MSAAVSGNPNATLAFATGDPDVFALGLLGARYAQNAAAAPLVAIAQYSVAVDISTLADPRDLLVGLMNPAITGGGFDLLQFALLVEDTALIDLTFTDPAAALAYFADHVLDFGVIARFIQQPDPGAEPIPLDVLARFTITTSAPGDGFSTQVLVANSVVPEPASALLFALGVGTLGVRRRR